MPPIDVVLDTNVVIAAMRSRDGASFRVLSLIGDPRFRLAISVPLIVEYEAVAMRRHSGIPLESDAIVSILDHICAVGRRVEIFFHWRPHLRDAEDEFILELAVAGGCRYIVTHNSRDFAGAEQFGIEVISPGKFLRLLGEAQ
jgi:putative PIN family toxin of toxin-antitoxin system